MYNWQIFNNETKITKFPKPKKNIPINWKEISFKYYQRFKHIKIRSLGPKTELEKLISKRQSRRNLGGNVSFEQLSKIITYSLSIRVLGENPRTESRRMAPSAGARYPIEAYLIITKNIKKGPSKGVYHYSPATNELETINDKLNIKNLKGLFAQDFIVSAPVIIVLTSVMERLTPKYKDRGYRYALLEAGHIAQNINLLAEESKLASCCICGFKDDELSRLLKIIDPEEIPLYSIALGK